MCLGQDIPRCGSETEISPQKTLHRVAAVAAVAAVGTVGTVGDGDS
jgi:hypothetical protein